MPAAESTHHAAAGQLSRASSRRGLVGLGWVQAVRAIVHAPIHRDTGGVPSHPRCPVSGDPTPSIGSAPRGLDTAVGAPGDGSAVHVEGDFSQPAHRRKAVRPGMARPSFPELQRFARIRSARLNLRGTDSTLYPLPSVLPSCAAFCSTAAASCRDCLSVHMHSDRNCQLHRSEVGQQRRCSARADVQRHVAAWQRPCP
jgi:hypothetical protein